MSPWESTRTHSGLPQRSSSLSTFWDWDDISLAPIGLTLWMLQFVPDRSINKDPFLFSFLHRPSRLISAPFFSSFIHPPLSMGRLVSPPCWTPALLSRPRGRQGVFVRFGWAVNAPSLSTAPRGCRKRRCWNENRHEEQQAQTDENCMEEQKKNPQIHTDQFELYSSGSATRIRDNIYLTDKFRKAWNTVDHLADRTVVPESVSVGISIY